MRKRVKPWGGRTEITPGLIEAGRATRFPNQRICCAMLRDKSRRCRKVALKGMRICGCHGGYGVLAQHGKLQYSPRTAAYRALAEKEKALAPMDLTRTQAYQQASEKMRIRMGLGELAAYV